MKELLKETNIFEKKDQLDPSETLLAMESLAWLLIDYDFVVKALPFLTLMLMKYYKIPIILLERKLLNLLLYLIFL